MASTEISLVQITATCFGIGGFLHGTFEIVIVWTRFSGKFHTFSALPECKSFLLSYRSCTTVCYAKAHIHTVAIVEKDNRKFLLADCFINTRAAGAQLHQRPCISFAKWNANKSGAPEGVPLS